MNGCQVLVLRNWYAVLVDYTHTYLHTYSYTKACCMLGGPPVWHALSGEIDGARIVDVSTIVLRLSVWMGKSHFWFENILNIIFFSKAQETQPLTKCELSYFELNLDQLF